MRKLRARIANEGRMNAASEQFLNFSFYFLLSLLGLTLIKVSTVTLLGIIATILLFVGFLGKDVTEKFMQGLVLILVQWPYDIRDRVLVNRIGFEPSPKGEPGWIVKDLTLYHTTFIYGATQEYATCANGYLADMRI